MPMIVGCAYFPRAAMARMLVLALLGLTLSASCGRCDDVSGSKPSLDSFRDVVNDIDRIFETKWRDLGITLAEQSDDSMFLRRITLDLTGRIPSANDARAFVKDQRPDKRMHAIEALFNNPRHARHLAGLWRDILLPRETAPGLADSFESWLRLKFQQQVAYDEMTRELLTARGTASQSNAVVFFTAHNVKPEELAASTSQVFLGVEVRCAQCHDHPTTKWKQDAFWGFAAFFARMEPYSVNAPNAKVDDQPEGEAYLPNSGAVASPRFLDGTEFAEATAEPRRAVLARWVASSDNPYFARAIANRVWWILLGRGIALTLSMTLSPHNPGTHPDVLDRLAADFNSHGADLRRLFRVVMSTRVYPTVQSLRQRPRARRGELRMHADAQSFGTTGLRQFVAGCRQSRHTGKHVSASSVGATRVPEEIRRTCASGHRISRRDSSDTGAFSLERTICVTDEQSCDGGLYFRT